MLKLRGTYSPEEKENMSALIRKSLFSLDEYKKARLLFVYVSLKNEVDTYKIIEDALKCGKRVAVPRCIEGRPQIEFYFIHGKGDLALGSYGILEPPPRTERLCTSKTGLCLLPGLAFDRGGMRLGYGKGYYDRFLQKFEGDTVGLCFSGILSEKPLPKGHFDVPADIVVTDKEIIRTNNNKNADKQ